ncbi:MAG: LPS export ABC transporter periplasmic protein LptC [Rhodospirillaceae bacterium]
MSNHEPERFATWTPRQTSVARSVEQYSRFVAMMKIALPAAAGFLLLLVVLLPQIRRDEDRYRIDTEISDAGGGESLTMTNARYFGTDDEGQPYSVVANGVKQNPTNQDTIELNAPSAEISLNDGKFLSAKANAGVYNRGEQKLDLSGDVDVGEENGYRFRTASALVNLDEGSASGKEPVTGEGPLGTMEAQGGFDLTDRGRTVHFNGKSRLVLNSKATAQTDNSTTGAAKPQGGKP